MPTSYHCEKDAEFWVERDVVAVGKNEGIFAFFFGGEDDGDLLRRDGQNRKFDAVEFVEATPGSRLRKIVKWQLTKCILFLKGAF